LNFKQSVIVPNVQVSDTTGGAMKYNSWYQKNFIQPLKKCNFKTWTDHYI